MTDTPAPAPATTVAAAETKVAKVAKSVVSVAGTVAKGILPASAWLGTWFLKLTGVTSFWSGVVQLARNPLTLVVVAPLILAAYLWGHHEEKRAAAAAINQKAMQIIKLQQDVALLQSRPVPVCTPGAAPAPASPQPAAAKPKRRGTARSLWQ